MAKRTPDPLETYRAKRALDRTPEPGGAVGRAAGRLFVMHQHAATRLHWDLRLELDGVLKSWAVPREPSFDQADKRLAVHVEDHPVEYGDFEGIIPEGNYGAGAVIVWDRGSWIPIEDPNEGLEKGKLLFELRGYKLRGRWTLVKIKGKGGGGGGRGGGGGGNTGKEWLFIKERDAWMTPGGREVPQTSVLSGLTVEDVRDGRDPAAGLREELERLGAPRGRVRVQDLEPMLAETADAPFTRKGWLFELKLDGYRIFAVRDGDQAMLRTRNRRDATATFPEIAKAIEALPYSYMLLDGEVIAADEQGRPSFQRLQQRGRFLRVPDIRRAAVENPVTYYAFDLLAFEDWDLRPLPLTQRKALLRRVLPPVGPLPFLEHFEEQGEALFERVQDMGLEGIVAKRADSAYRGGRSPHWLKIRSDRTDDFVVVGFTAPRGSRAGFGALQVADYVDGTLTYAGRVGSGFSAEQLAEWRSRLEALRRETPPCKGPLPANGETTWVEPELVCEVRFKEWTDDDLLRQPVFLRLRDDKAPSECVRETRLTDVTEPEEVPEVRTVAFSNLDKVFWKEEGYTKGDLVAYYRAISPWLLPYLRGRPVVLTRYPDGIDGKSFFQKDAPKFIPEWLRTERMWSEDARREIDYFVCDDEPSLLYLANLASIPLHIWASRVETLDRPDWCVLDLDPKGAPFPNVIAVARALHELCEEIGLPSWVKTTGSTGLHVLLPLGRQFSYEQCRSFGELLSRVIVDEHREIATLTRVIERREGKVYLDYLQNGHGRLIVAPFSVRPLPGAPVSMPLRWEEVRPGLESRDYTIRTAPARMERLGDDPMRPVLSEVPDLMAVLATLKERGKRGD
ncbi:MAG TPA: DNA ligase D [Gemmatimonadales bacterium]